MTASFIFPTINISRPQNVTLNLSEISYSQVICTFGASYEQNVNYFGLKTKLSRFLRLFGNLFSNKILV